MDESVDQNPTKDPPPAPSISPGRLAAQLLDATDLAFLESIKAAGLIAELDEAELLRIASEVMEDDQERRRIDLLETYYRAEADEVAIRRMIQDRFFLQRVGSPATAAGLVARFGALWPEVPNLLLQRVGGADGPLALRSGEHFSAVLDDYEEELNTDEYDLAELEARRDSVALVTVRGLVRAFNVLLEKNDVRRRLVELRGDEEREIYVGLGFSDAMDLARADLLEDQKVEDVMEMGCW